MFLNFLSPSKYAPTVTNNPNSLNRRCEWTQTAQNIRSLILAFPERKVSKIHTVDIAVVLVPLFVSTSHFKFEPSDRFSQIPVVPLRSPLTETPKP